MSKIFKNDTGTKFLFFTNYKVMNSNLVNILNENFPGIKVFTSIDKINEFEDYIKLVIVRNPYDRLLSLFFDKCREHPRKVRIRDNRIWLQNNQVQILNAAAHLFNKHTAIVRSEKEIDKRSSDYDQLLKNFSVLESLEFIDFVEITAYLFSQSSMDAHFHPQSWIMIRNGSMVIDHYYKLENIQQEWKEICALIGKQIVLNEGVNRTNFEGPDKYRKFYTDDMKKKVYDLYHADFVNFGYDY